MFGFGKKERDKSVYTSVILFHNGDGVCVVKLFQTLGGEELNSRVLEHLYSNGYKQAMELGTFPTSPLQWDNKNWKEKKDV